MILTGQLVVGEETLTENDNPSIDAGYPPPLERVTRPPAVDAPDDDQLLDPILTPTDKVIPLLYPTAFLILTTYDPDGKVDGTAIVKLVLVDAAADRTVVTEVTELVRLAYAKVLLSRTFVPVRTTSAVFVPEGDTLDLDIAVRVGDVVDSI